MTTEHPYVSPASRAKPPEEALARRQRLSHRQPICVHCMVNFQPERNGVLVRLDENCIVEADLWRCPSCQRDIVSGFARDYVDRNGYNPTLFQQWDERLGESLIGYPLRGERFA